MWADKAANASTTPRTTTDKRAAIEAEPKGKVFEMKELGCEKWRGVEMMLYREERMEGV